MGTLDDDPFTYDLMTEEEELEDGPSVSVPDDDTYQEWDLISTRQ